ncbi:hypothetical protein NQ314_010738 [Rhamnusium bicolor]|uniref:Uncharacterized protein n=1 Tax=Rhamnusium bicolor TaxID=1586634 RepID=A0AAV8XMR6_9CUCU|nr:hypothetical protein NQ314_010738 [Rhamnusium bicolor]
MGNCFKSCLPQSDATRALRNLNILSNPNHDVDFTFLVEDSASTSEENKSLGELESWLSSHSTIPEGMHEVYVIEYEIIEKDEENDSPKFRFALSTKFLLQLARDVKNIHADATYKLVWQRFPVFVVGILELVDGLLNPQLTSYSRLSESQRLSSIGTAIPEDLSQCPTNSSPQNTAPAHNSDSDWSRVSSANSLEWDNVQNSIHMSPHISEVDTDTQFLLSEIERLTNKTLEETGQDLFS